MILQQNISQSLHSPIVIIVLGTIALGLLYVLWREVRKIPAKLFTLMATAFVDMLGLLMIIPLLPFYVKSLRETGSISWGGTSESEPSWVSSLLRLLLHNS